MTHFLFSQTQYQETVIIKKLQHEILNYMTDLTGEFPALWVASWTRYIFNPLKRTKSQPGRNLTFFEAPSLTPD